MLTGIENYLPMYREYQERFAPYGDTKPFNDHTVEADADESPEEMEGEDDERGCNGKM